MVKGIPGLFITKFKEVSDASTWILHVSLLR